MVSFTLRQITSVIDQPGLSPAYRVTSQVTSATGSSPAIFVYKAADIAYDHVAGAADMERWPDNREAAIAGGLGFYRLDNTARAWPLLSEMLTDRAETQRRTRSLAKELAAQRASAETDETIVIEEG